MAFTSADINKIANKVVDILADVPKGTPEVQQQVNSVELDPMVKVMDRIAEKAMDDLPTGVVAYRGRNGTQIINHSEETINTLDNIRRNRKNFRTRQNVR